MLRVEVHMLDPLTLHKKPPTRAGDGTKNCLLVGRKDAARMLSISERSLDYLLANQQLHARRIGSRVLIAVSELEHYARTDHPQRVAS